MSRDTLAALAVGLVMVCAGSAGAQQIDPAAQAPAVQPATPVAPAAPPVTPSIDREAFDRWLAEVRKDALSRGIKADTLDRALTGLEPAPQVLERDRQQAEFTLDLKAYLKRRLTPETLRSARRLQKKYLNMAERVARTYGVSPRVQIAVWALESNFGRFSGVRPSLPTLATLAFDGRRAELFRGELLDALTILDRGDIELEHLRGSWAGALGQVQFLPSSYLAWAVDFDKDGRRDIWRSLPDVFASIANYLHGHGWAADGRWGYEVKVPEAASAAIAAVPQRTSGCRAVRDLSEPKTIAEWKAIGVVATKKTLPESTRPASLLRLDDRVWLVTESYEALLAYNCAHTYAISVATLADKLPK
jgi:membrane-bound lytic murein transglycosylase B